MKTAYDYALQAVRFAVMAFCENRRQLARDDIMREFWQALEYGRLRACDNEDAENLLRAALAQTRRAARLARDARRHLRRHGQAHSGMIDEAIAAALAAADCAGTASVCPW